MKNGINFVRPLTVCFLLSAMCMHIHAERVSAMGVLAATRTCERAVPENCAINLCATYCEAYNAHAVSHRAERIAACRQQCPSHCQPNVKATDPFAKKQGMFDMLGAQVRDQLAQCIAQHRDPDGQITGRRKANWWEVMSPRYRDLLIKAGIISPQSVAHLDDSYSARESVGTGEAHTRPRPAKAYNPQAKQFRMTQEELDLRRAALRSTGRNLSR